jgi:hypothetical protein
MKSIKFFAAMFVAASMFAFTGCSKDYEDEIIGTWKVTSIIVTETFNGQSHTEDETPQGENTLTFNEDKTVVATTVEEGHTETENGTYSIDDDTLIMTLEGETQRLAIDIDGNDMTLTLNQSFSEGDMTMSMKAVMKLKKI